MEEMNTKNPNEVKQIAPKPAPKKERKANSSSTFTDYKAEFKKIIWPKRDELSKNTVSVIVTSLLMGVVIFCMDTVYTAGYDAIISLLG